MDRRLIPGWRAWPIAVLAGVALTVPTSAHGATWAVNDTVDTPVGQSCPGFTNCSLREAVTSTEANPGADAILVSAPGTYVLTNGQLSVTQDLEVSRVGAGSVTISGSNASRIFDVSASGADLSLRFMTLTDGREAGPGPSYGGAIRGAAGTTITIGSTSVSDSDVVADSDARGGAIYTDGALTIGLAPSSTTASTITGNSATTTTGGSVQGGAVAVGTTGSLAVGSRTTISGNDATAAGTGSTARGGGVFAGSGATFTEVTVAGTASPVGTPTAAASA